MDGLLGPTPDRGVLGRLTPSEGVREMDEGDRGVPDGVRLMDGALSRGIDAPGVRDGELDPRRNSSASDGDRFTEGLDGLAERPGSVVLGRRMSVGRPGMLGVPTLRWRSDELPVEREIDGVRPGEVNRDSPPGVGRVIWPSGRAMDGVLGRSRNCSRPRLLRFGIE